VDFLIYLRHQWDRVGAWVCIVVGALLLLLGWLGVSREVLPAAQLPYVVSGGLGGVFLLGLGAVLWLSADLRDEWRQLHEIAEAAAMEAMPVALPAREPVAPPDDSDSAVSNGSRPSRRRPRATPAKQ
jgi:hypothetical protein